VQLHREALGSENSVYVERDLHERPLQPPQRRQLPASSHQLTPGGRDVPMPSEVRRVQLIVDQHRLWPDGVPAATAGLTPEEGDEWVLRDFGQGTGPRRQPGKDYERDPLVVVVCSYYDGSLAELQAGEALQSLLLTATTLGLASSFMSQIIEVPQARAEMRQILGPGLVPQAIIRLGYGSPVAASRRRPVSELLLNETAGTSA